jgi:HPt (histidine-containing phosphotransfer) domain-containing protein
MQSRLEGQTRELLPLIDLRVMNDWCADLASDDVLAILARVPDECRKCVGEIEKAMVEGSLTAVKRAAHRLKGMAGNLGAARLAQIARCIELGGDTIEDIAKEVGKLQETLAETLAALRSAASQ